MWQQGVRFTDLKLRTVASASEFSEARIELLHLSLAVRVATMQLQSPHYNLLQLRASAGAIPLAHLASAGQLRRLGCPWPLFF